MTWHYQAFHVTTKDEDWYEVREVYAGLNDDGSDAYTERCIAAKGDTKNGLVMDLTRMRDDVLRFPAVEVEK